MSFCENVVRKQNTKGDSIVRVDEAIYRFWMQRRRARFLRNAVRLENCAVISVGNLSVGGTGKTPTVQFLARGLQKRQARVAVVSRGHGGTLSEKSAIVSDGETVFLNAQQAGDEPLLHARSLPNVGVVIGKDRVTAAQNAIRVLDCDTILLDDAFGFWSLQRDLNIVLLDARAPFGNITLPNANAQNELRRNESSRDSTAQNEMSNARLANARLANARVTNAPGEVVNVQNANPADENARNETARNANSEIETSNAPIANAPNETMQAQNVNPASENALNSTARNAILSGAHLLPRGRLREEPAALKRADILILTRCERATSAQIENAKTLLRRFSDAPIFHARHVVLGLRDETSGEDFSLETLRDFPVGALSAIADNLGFAQSLRENGAQIVATKSAFDHHRWRENEVRRFSIEAAKLGAQAVVTTEKDAVKLQPNWCAPIPLWSLRIGVEIEEADKLWAQIDEVCRKFWL